MISVSGLAKHFGPQVLFADATFQLNPGERHGLVGANGSGKSTLLKVLTGQELSSEGTVAIPKRLRVGVLRQDHFVFENDRIRDVVMMGNQQLWEAFVEREELLAKAEESFDAERYAELEDIVLKHDGYTAEARAAEILEGLGIPEESHLEPLSILSGGFKLRVLLAQTLAAEPDALLLDEPTNHLDILSIRWLEKFLQEFSGTVVVVSHDHRFLDNVCTHILDVDYQTVTLYRGAYTDFITRRSPSGIARKRRSTSGKRRSPTTRPSSNGFAPRPPKRGRPRASRSSSIESCSTRCRNLLAAIRPFSSTSDAPAAEQCSSSRMSASRTVTTRSFGMFP